MMGSSQRSRCRRFFFAICYFCLPGFCMAQKWDIQDTLKVQRPITEGVGPTAYRPSVVSLVIPTAFIGYGLISLGGDNVVRRLDYSTKNELQEDHPLFAAHADDYLQFVPAAAVYALHIAGVKGQHTLLDATGLYVLSSAIVGGSVIIVKRATHRERPNGAGFDSFPSGHTANAFAAAEFLNQEYRGISPWYGIAGYAVATATGTLRMYNNKHWFSDVVAGAGFGILSTKAAYFLYPKLKRLISGNRAMNYNLVPSYQQHSFGLSFNGTF